MRPKRTREDVTARALDRLFPGASWAPWKAALAAMLAQPLTTERVAIVEKCTGLRAFSALARTWVFICGRRAGKSSFMAGVAVCLATLKTYKHRPGEQLIGMLLAADKKQAGILKNYIAGLLHSVPELAALIVRETASEIELSNGVTIGVYASTYRSVRGYSCIFVVCDEIAFWPSDGPETDAETLNALMPTLLTTGGPLILCSSPYARLGALYDYHRRYFGVDGDVRVWVAPSAMMNSTVDAQAIEAAYRADPERASAEYGAQFRSDLSSLFDAAVLGACVIPGRRELPPQPGVSYVFEADTSGGSDESFGGCIAHKDLSGRVIIDVIREWAAPFDPAVVVAECAALAKRYGCAVVTGDKYAAQWPVSAFKAHGITYVASDKNKSELFLEAVATINAKQVELLDHSRTLAQFAGLQRRTGSSGRDTVDHRPGQRDDLANAVAGAMWLCQQSTALATYPADFHTCNRAASIPSFTLSTCFLFGGMNVPPADAICRACPGRQFAVAAHKAAVERGEEIDLRRFVRERIDPEANLFTARVRHFAWMAADHGF